MQLYLYSCQDLIIYGNHSSCIKAGKIYRIEINQNEDIIIYYKYSAGVIFLNLELLLAQQHNQINFYKLSKNALLCEIKPFVVNDNSQFYTIKGAGVKIINQANNAFIYFNNCYYGMLSQKFANIEFKSIETGSHKYGIVYLNASNKYLILFNSEKIMYCGRYIDVETKKEYMQIYQHLPNIFNVGRLIKCEFENNIIYSKTIDDRGGERKQQSGEFVIVYFLEAIKCGRVKYAYNKLSYELKSEINIDVLKNYFSSFDEYVYLNEQDAYITLKNNKVIGIYHFVVKDNLIDNIY